MDCSRCDSSLDRYALGGREAVICEACGYIGVPVEHRGEDRTTESWNDALSRFRTRHRTDREELTPAFVFRGDEELPDDGPFGGNLVSAFVPAERDD